MVINVVEHGHPVSFHNTCNVLYPMSYLLNSYICMWENKNHFVISRLLIIVFIITVLLYIVPATVTDLCSLNTEFSRTIFSNNSISSLGRSAVIKAFTVTEMSSGSWVSDRAVCTTYIVDIIMKYWITKHCTQSTVCYKYGITYPAASVIQECSTLATNKLSQKWKLILFLKVKWKQFTIENVIHSYDFSKF